MNYQTKPIPVQALQYNGENINECMSFCNTNACVRLHVVDKDILKLAQKENDAYCHPSDYIVILPDGYYQRWSETAFNSTFEAAPAVTE